MQIVLKVLFASTLLLTLGQQAVQAEDVRWLRDYDQAVDAAKRSNSPLLIYVTHPSCHFCRKMERQTYSDEGVARRLNSHFVAVIVDAAEQPGLASQLRVAGYPAALITGPDLQLRDRADGFIPPSQFAERLDAVTTPRR